MIAILFAVLTAAFAFQGGAETIVKDNMSNVDEPRQAVARTAAEWTALWRAHDFNKPAPKVDFNTRTVVAIFLGSRPTAGYDVEIIGTKKDGNALIVEWAESRPEKGVMLAQVLTSPALMVSIPKVTGEVTFRKVTR
jgi:hypothetical protein